MILEEENISCAVTMAFLDAMNLKNPHLFRHSLMVGRIAEKLAYELGFAKERVSVIRKAGLLHDIGKIAVRDDILLKPTPLDEEEWAHIKQHPQIGARTLQKFAELEEEAFIILHHHEREDGTGYPYGLPGTAIPVEAKIVQISDVFAATISERPYKPPYPHGYAAKVSVELFSFDDNHKSSIEAALRNMLNKETASAGKS